MTELRPLLRASLLLYAYRVGASTLVAYPIARTLTAFGATMHVEGDRSLFESGGFRLLESLRLGGPSLSASAESGVLIGACLAVLGLLPLAAAMAVLARPSAGHGDVAKRAIELFPVFLKLGAAAVLVQGVICAVAAAVAPTLSGFAGVIANEKARDLVVLAALLPAAVAVVGLGIWEDVARAAAVDGAPRARDAAQLGLAALVGRPAATLGACAVMAAGGCTAVAISAAAVGFIDVSRPGVGRVVAVAAVHQATLFVVAALRVAWLRVGLSRVRSGGPGGSRLPVDLNVAPSRAIPSEIEPHDPAAQRT
jgi:hypothetical protein